MPHAGYATLSIPVQMTGLDAFERIKERVPGQGASGTGTNMKTEGTGEGLHTD